MGLVYFVNDKEGQEARTMGARTMDMGQEGAKDNNTQY